MNFKNSAFNLFFHLFCANGYWNVSLAPEELELALTVGYAELFKMNLAFHLRLNFQCAFAYLFNFYCIRSNVRQVSCDHHFVSCHMNVAQRLETTRPYIPAWPFSHC